LTGAAGVVIALAVRCGDAMSQSVVWRGKRDES
jgi:hypothetical protein